MYKSIINDGRKAMDNLFEKSDVLNSPVDAMVFDASQERFPIENHWHYFMEIIYLHKGSVEYTCSDRSGRLEMGEMAIFPPKAVHSIRGGDSGLPVYSLLKFDVNRLRIASDYSPRFSEVFRRAESDPNACMTFDVDQCRHIGAKELICQCIDEMNNRRYGYGTVMDAGLYILLTRIVRLWMDSGFSLEHSAARLNSDPIYSITEYIDAHYAEELKVTELAEMCGISYSYFAKSFKAIYRQSCRQFINYLRVSKAADYLIFTDHDLNRISQETGFSDCSHFIRVFRSIKGVTPGKYRASRKS